MVLALPEVISTSIPFSLNYLDITNTIIIENLMLGILGYKTHRTSKTGLWEIIQKFIQEAMGCENYQVTFYGVQNFSGQIRGTQHLVHV